MHITQILNSRKISFSFEFFPPKDKKASDWIRRHEKNSIPGGKKNRGRSCPESTSSILAKATVVTGYSCGGAGNLSRTG